MNVQRHIRNKDLIWGIETMKEVVSDIVIINVVYRAYLILWEICDLKTTNKEKGEQLLVYTTKKLDNRIKRSEIKKALRFISHHVELEPCMKQFAGIKEDKIIRDYSYNPYYSEKSQGKNCGR